MTPKEKPNFPLSYYGGKVQMLQHILPLLPDHELYAEPFAGGASVFWAKNPVPIECLNDTNRALMTFYQVLQTRQDELTVMAGTTLHSEDSHRFARIVMANPHFFDPVRIAWAVWVLATQSFASALDKQWGYTRKPNSSGSDAMTTKLGNKKALFELMERGGLPYFKARLEGVQLDCTNALQVIKRRDSVNTFFYLDPPYFNSDCAHYAGYAESEFDALLTVLASTEAKWMLSCYDSPLLQRHVEHNPSWTVLRFQKALTASVANRTTAKPRGSKQELLVMNYQSNHYTE